MKHREDLVVPAGRELRKSPEKEKTAADQVVLAESELRKVLEKTTTAADRGLQTTSEKADMAADLEVDGIVTEEVADGVTMQAPP